MPIQRLNHAVLYVRDVERSVAFYSDALGFRVVMAMPGAAFLQAEGSSNDHDLGLFEVGAEAGASPAGQPTTVPPPPITSAFPPPVETPVSITDAKETTHPWTQTLHYDETSGVLTSTEVSGVGTFTAAYDADGDLIRRGLTTGLTGSTTSNAAGEPMNLA